MFLTIAWCGGRRAYAGGVLPDGYRFAELTADHAAALADAYRRNREHLRRREPARDDDFFTAEGQVASIVGQLSGVRAGLTASWLLTEGERVVGRVNLNSIVMGVLRSGSVGYWVDAAHCGRGLATAAVELVCEQARGRGLHRVEGATLLHNLASQRVLERCGFLLYGVAPSFLFIDGRWQDHRLYQRILHDDPL